MLDTIIIKAREQQPYNNPCNIHLAIYPFKLPGREWVRSLSSPEDAGAGILGQEALPLWQQALVKRLFDELPGLQTMFLRNSEITLQHVGVIGDDQMIAEAKRILTPFLEQELKLMKLGGQQC